MGLVRDMRAAHEVSAARRAITMEYKARTPSPLRHYIFYVNMLRYSDPIGLPWDEPTPDKFRVIMAKAAQTNDDVGALLQGYGTWLLTQPDDYIRWVGEYLDVL